MFLGYFSGNAHAAILTWTNGGGNNLASTPANWFGGKAPQDGDRVVFDGTSTNDCTRGNQRQKIQPILVTNCVYKYCKCKF